MIRTRLLIGLATICLATNQIAFAQIVERSGGEGGELQFSAAILGKWEIEKVVASGRDISENYGPSLFTKDSWTIQTKDRNHVYKLTEVNESSNPLEATFEHSVVKGMSFTAFIVIEDGRLGIVRGIGPENPIPLPQKMEAGPGTLVYVFKKAVDEKPATADNRVPLNVRLIDETKDSKVLVDVTVKPFFGGKLAYSSESKGVSAKIESSPRIGTVISGKMEPSGNGEWSVLLVVEFGKQEQSELAETTILRSEKLQVETVVRADKVVRIKCSENRILELTLK
ncbi:MAG: hypothetical protein U0930_10170 [Pirellulales bacterium]